MFFKRGKQDKSKPAEAPPEAPKEAAPKETGGKSAGAEGASARASSSSAVAIDPESLGFKTTADLNPASEPVGQTRALEALAFGAGMKGPGYNILVVGGQGSGSTEAARAKIKEVAAAKKRAPDWAYVRYFDDDGGFRA